MRQKKISVRKPFLNVAREKLLTELFRREQVLREDCQQERVNLLLRSTKRTLLIDLQNHFPDEGATRTQLQADWLWYNGYTEEISK